MTVKAKKVGLEAEREYVADLEKARIECGARAREALARDLEARRRRREWAEGQWFSAPTNSATRERYLFGAWISEAEWESWGPSLRPYILLELRRVDKRGAPE